MSTSFGSVPPSSNFGFYGSANQNPFQNNDNNSNNSITQKSNNNTFSNINVFQNAKNQKEKKPKKNVQKHKKFIMSHNRNTVQLGQLLDDPAQFGFKQLNHKPREIPRFLISQQPQLKPKKFIQDHWDKINQSKMLDLENSIDDMTELYERLKKMRDTERKIMEDKGLVDKADFAKDLNDAIVFQGTCLDMCSTFERARRNVEYTVYSYEKDDPNDKKASRTKALKVFARPAAAAAPPLPSDVRPPHILVKTLDYIIDNLVVTLPDSEGFIWDRMRSIRQDFTYQNYCGPEAVDCNERIVRIHLLILHVMVKSKVEFSLQQELEQLHKSLITLSEIYDDVRANGGSCPNEAEFRAYASLSKIRDPQYDKAIQDLPKHIFEDNLVQLALCFRRIISNSYYIERGFMRTESCLNLYMQFFRLIQSVQVPFLMSSFLEIYLNEVRFYALKTLSLSLNKKHKPISASLIAQELLYNNMGELLEFCQYYSINIIDDGIDLKSLTVHSHRLSEKKPLKNCYLQCVDSKLNAQPFANFINSGKPNIDTIREDLSNRLDTTTIEEEIPTVPVINRFNELKQGVTLPESVVNSSSNRVTVSTPPPSSLSSSNSLISRNVVPNFKPSNIEVSQQVSLSIEPNQVAKPTFSLTPFHSFKKPDEVAAVTVDANIGAQEEIKGQHEKEKLKQEIERKRQEQAIQETEGLMKLQSKEEERELKRKQSLILKQKAANKIANDLIKSVVEINSKNIVEQCLNNQHDKSKLIDDIALGLYDAFIHEKIYITFLKAKADNLRSIHHKASLYKKWVSRLRKKQESDLNIKRRKDELQIVEKQLGVPSINKSKRLLTTPINDNNSSFLMNSARKNKELYSPVNNESNRLSLELVKKKGPLWKPLDLQKLYFDNIVEKYDKHSKSSSDIFLYAKNWASISNSWILNKFNVEDSKSIVQVGDERLKLNIICIDEKFNPADFTDVQLLVFNTGVTEDNIFDLEMKLQQDGEELIKLVTGVALNSNINFNLLIIYWESSETQLADSTISKLLKLNRIDTNFSGVLENVGFAKITDKYPDKSLEKGLTRISQCFRYKLTDRGRYHASLNKKRNMRVTSQDKQLKITQSIDDKMKTMLKAEREAYERQMNEKNTYAHLQSHISASPKMRKRKLPVLVSETKSSKFKTPLASKMRYSSHSSFGSPPQQSHLAMKVRGTDSRHSLYHGLLPSGTPSHSTNVPNTSYDGHVIPSFGSSVGNNSMNQNTSFRSANRESDVFQTPSSAVIENNESSPPPPPDRRSNDLQELKSLIASVKKKVNHDHNLPL